MRPTLIEFGPVSIRAYGLMLVLAFVVGTTWAAFDARRRGLPPERMIDAGLAALVGGLLGARILFVALDPYLGWRDAVFIWRGGLSFHGGLVGGIGAVAAYAYLSRVSLATILDAGAPAVALGYAVARIGCFLNGCCYGCPTGLPWGMHFTDELTGGLTALSHPTQLYASLGSLAVFAILLRLRPRARAPGQLFGAYLGLYGVVRFAVEIFRRGATAGPLLGPLTAAQWASIVLVVGGAIAWWALGRAGARREAPHG